MLLPWRLLPVALALVVGATAAAEEPSEFVGFRVRASAPSAAAVGAPAPVTVEIEALPSHYFYGERTSIALHEKRTGVSLGTVVPPDTGERKIDEIEGKEMLVYEAGIHRFVAPITFAKPGRQTVRLDVTSQACNHGDKAKGIPALCLFPKTETVAVTVAVAPAREKPVSGSGAGSPTGSGPGAASGSGSATVPGSATDSASVSASATAAGSASGSDMATATDADPASVSAAIAPAAPRPASIFQDSTRMAELIRSRFLLALLVAFAGGFFVSFTPCVYPMIPITVAVIGARSATSRRKGFALSLVYVAGITLVYASLGLFAALTSREFGFLLQSPWVRLGIALVFALLAASMFGAFSIELPSSIQTRLSRPGGSGVGGVFVTGLFSGIVAGPCTAPVLLGILLAISSGSVGPIGGLSLMSSFSLGMGVLFVALGTFSGLLATLPKSGTWMVRVKQFFGLLLAGGALYFLQLAVPPWVFGLALGGSLVLGGVALGALRRHEPGDAGGARVAQAAGLLALAAGLYFFVAALHLSGWGPTGSTAVPPSSAAPSDRRAVAGLEAMPWIDDEAEGRRRSTAQSKPMLIDFYADWCQACKELDHETYVDPRVIAAAADFVPVKVDTTVRFDTPEAEKARIEAIKRRYDVKGLPKVAFVTPQGAILEPLTITGFVPADDLLARMEEARTLSGVR